MNDEERIFQELTEVRPELLNEKALELFNFIMKKLDELKEKDRQLKIKDEYMKLALDLMCDYDGFYDEKTKKGNAKCLASLIDDVRKLANGALNNDVRTVWYEGEDKKYNILMEEL